MSRLDNTQPNDTFSDNVCPDNAYLDNNRSNEVSPDKTGPDNTQPANATEFSAVEAGATEFSAVGANSTKANPGVPHSVKSRQTGSRKTSSTKTSPTKTSPTKTSPTKTSPTKILWIIIACLFGAGLALAGTGFALGASGRAYLDATGFHLGSSAYQELYFDSTGSTLEPFNTVSVNLEQAEVKLVVAKEYGYTFSYQGYHSPVVRAQGGTLVVGDPAGGGMGSWDWLLGGHININFGWLWGESEKATLTVYVPEGTALDEVNLNVASGETRFDGAGITIGSLNGNSTSGSMNLSNVVAENLNVSAASGNVLLKNLEVANMNVSLVSGRFDATEARAGYLTISMVSGRTNYQGSVAHNLTLNTVSGSATIRLAGKADDYRYEVHRISGDIRLNGHSLFDRPASGTTNPAKTMSLDVVSGAIDLFIE